MKTITVKWSNEDLHACSDANVHKWINKVLDFEDDEGVVFVATLTQLSVLRVAHKNKQINIAGIVYKDVKISIYENAQLNNWPRGFLDEFDHLLDELVGWSL